MLAIDNPHTIKLPGGSAFQKLVPNAVAPKPLDPKDIASQWLEKFAEVLSTGDASKLDRIIFQDAWWRDQLAVTWDMRTLHGLDRISSYLAPNIAEIGFQKLKLQDTGIYQPREESPSSGLSWVESMFSFETAVGRGKGMLRLVQDQDGTYRALMIYTALQEIKGHEELIGARRPHGGNESLKDGVKMENWLERRQKEVEFKDGDPAVLIIGAGQSGLNVGARLRNVGISSLLIDKNERVGDNWRNRYRTLVTHDPVQYTHMAFMKFPSNWPLFTPKDKLGDWFEIYGSAMELNIWLKTTVKSASYDDATQLWTVSVLRNSSEERILKPKHIVFATGHAGEPKIPTFSGQEKFKGIVYHGSQHEDATVKGHMAGKKVIVVGTGNSGHDIAQNYYECGANVSMLQRRGTYVISAKKGLFMLHEGIYDETGPPIEDADICAQSLPIPIQFALNVGLTERIKEAERENIEGLTKAGFKLDFAEDGSGIYRKYITRGGGYYIDIGASQLIIDGKIKVIQSPDGIEGFEENALVLADGRKLEADIVVLATGFDNMRTTARKILGDKIADRAKDVWDLDEEGEVNTMWRPSGHPGLWFMGGSLALCRIHSRTVALQIQAALFGLNKDYRA
ncbi:putative flavin-containing monooxygenase YUCCA3 [Pseudomassariella vexata]|uniref:Putative flavin-containing monooxygenase YUCCA3 n=1 Tax=Pseudomassariella vexata TaxID=1141098 RepID=A0A1Y2DZE8_9PEZI|nr:putative flavin-containing monooxygenase YUCCA3 [Pseudomassariella vexata]ORY64474.1 putative flavin-containing monooxygenase YUCCA3 [Pseudomassariella vexata]